VNAFRDQLVLLVPQAWWEEKEPRDLLVGMAHLEKMVTKAGR